MGGGAAEPPPACVGCGDGSAVLWSQLPLNLLLLFYKTGPQH